MRHRDPAVKKAAFVFGGESGKGLMACRKGAGWSAPVFMQLQKGSWGLQIGAQSIDLILLVINERGMNKLLGDKVTLGAKRRRPPARRTRRARRDRRADQAEILPYARTQGLFAGTTCRAANSAGRRHNDAAYGKQITPSAILTGGTSAPPAPPRSESAAAYDVRTRVRADGARNPTRRPRPRCRTRSACRRTAVQPNPSDRRWARAGTRSSPACRRWCPRPSTPR